MVRKKFFTLLIVFNILGWSAAKACELCKENQPAGLENVTHGAGPTGTIDYIITWTAVSIVAVTLFLSFKYLIWPKESAPDHIKNIVLN
ncbi:hypothetical protein [uncultured Imperialibacter sp.]|uniref:hypothetical protein n=1 Tax=Imperialibacter sp. TaxID=2038411 RepID=UPI0030DB67D8|tara:strand:- start:13347 stop:13613 length:267 start_codon:yes stop_codon:yes gene_type:complete